MENLLPPDILQSTIQILDPLHNILNLALVRTLNLACLSNSQIKRKSDTAQRSERRKPAARVRRGGREADLVVSRIGGAEGEAASMGALLVDDAVVVVEYLLCNYQIVLWLKEVKGMLAQSRTGKLRTYINRDQDVQPIMLRPRLPILIEFLRIIMSHNQRILRQLLEEAFGRRAVDVEVEVLDWDKQGAQREERND